MCSTPQEVNLTKTRAGLQTGLMLAQMAESDM